MARSNVKSHFLFEIDGRTHADTAHGGGLGAWAKMWRRTTAVLFPELTDRQVNLINADDPTRLVVRTPAGEVVVSCVEVHRS